MANSAPAFRLNLPEDIFAAFVFCGGHFYRLTPQGVEENQVYEKTFHHRHIALFLEESVHSGHILLKDPLLLKESQSFKLGEYDVLIIYREKEGGCIAYQQRPLHSLYATVPHMH